MYGHKEKKGIIKKETKEAPRGKRAVRTKGTGSTALGSTNGAASGSARRQTEETSYHRPGKRRKNTMSLKEGDSRGGVGSGILNQIKEIPISLTS